MHPGQAALVTSAAFLAGGVNAIAGGGSLISFPALLAVGVKPVAANITNTVALCSGYLGGAISQRRTLTGQRDRLRRLLLVGALGGLTGAVLLVSTSDTVFKRLIPPLLFAASGLLGFRTASADGCASVCRWSRLMARGLPIRSGSCFPSSSSRFTGATSARA